MKDCFVGVSPGFFCGLHAGLSKRLVLARAVCIFPGVQKEERKGHPLGSIVPKGIRKLN